MRLSLRTSRRTQRGRVREMLDESAGLLRLERAPGSGGVLLLLIQFLPDGRHLATVEVGDLDRPPALGGAGHSLRTSVADGLLAKGVGDNLEPPARLDELALGQVRGPNGAAVSDHGARQIASAIAASRSDVSTSWSCPSRLRVEPARSPTVRNMQSASLRRRAVQP